MWPQTLPSYVESAAERLLYDEFAKQLPDDFTVIYGVKWLIRDPRRHDKDGEIDFLIIHPHLGLLVLEVKGGRVRVDDKVGSWYSIDRSGTEHKIKNPFDQARSNYHNLRSKLAEAPQTKPYFRQYRTRRGIALPDVRVGPAHIGLYGDRNLIVDSTDLFHLEESIRRIYGTSEPENRLSQRAIDAVVDLVAPTIEITTFGLGRQMHRAEKHIVELTEEQYGLLDVMRGQRRVAVSGCAGSGKTMLAIEKAKRLVNEGYRVLFTCYNANLA